MPIQFRHELSPLISGPMAWLGGYGIQRGQGSAQVAQQAQAMNSEANANFRQAFDAMNQMGQQAMQHVYRTAEQNQAYKQSLELMPIQAKNALDITSMNRNGVPWDGPNGIVAQAEAKGITVPQYLEQQTQQKAVQALRMKGYEMGYSPQAQREYNQLQTSIAATTADPTIPQEIKPRLIQGMMQRMQAIPQTPQPINRPPSNQEIGQQAYERPLKGGGTAYHYSPNKPPILNRAPSGGGGASGKKTIAETNPMFAPGGPLEGFDESARFAPPQIIKDPVKVQEWLSKGRPTYDNNGNIDGYLNEKGTKVPLKDGAEAQGGIDAKAMNAYRTQALKNAQRKKLNADGEEVGTYTDWEAYDQDLAEQVRRHGQAPSTQPAGGSERPTLRWGSPPKDPGSRKTGDMWRMNTPDGQRWIARWTGSDWELVEKDQ